MSGIDTGNLPSWKVDLILQRVRRKRLNRHDAEDATQQIALAAITFKFDQAKSNGASERTVLTAIIKKQLAHLDRTRLRSARKLREYRAHHQKHSLEKAFDQHRRAQEQIDLALDMTALLSGLPEKTRRACVALMEGKSLAKIAVELRCSRRLLATTIKALCKTFTERGSMS